MFKTACFFFLFFSSMASAQSWQKLHRKAIVADTHNDVLSSVTLKGMDIGTNLKGRSHTDLARLKQGGVDVEVFSIFCDERFGRDTAYRFANIEIDSLYALIARHPDQMMLVTSPEALKKAVKQKKLACMIGVEGGHMIEDDPAKLEALFRRGARYLTLTWNNSTSWATSAWDETKKKDSLPHLGLNDFGKNIVRRMNELGMMVDVSHVGEQTFWDVIHTTTKPVIASHSCAYALCPVPRNLKDHQIIAIAKNGGVIQLNFYSGFLDSTYAGRKDAFLLRHSHETDSLKQLNWPAYQVEEWITQKYKAEAESLRPPLSLLMDHLDYIVKLAGIDHVGLGSDFDGIESAPKTLDDVSCFPLITWALVERGYSKKDIMKILGGNFLRVFSAQYQ
jgi:membrane dipeptidase